MRFAGVVPRGREAHVVTDGDEGVRPRRAAVAPCAWAVFAPAVCNLRVRSRVVGWSRAAAYAHVTGCNNVLDVVQKRIAVSLPKGAAVCVGEMSGFSGFKLRGGGTGRPRGGTPENSTDFDWVPCTHSGVYKAV